MLSPVNCARPVLNRDWLLLSSPEFRREPTVTDVMRLVTERTGISRSMLRSPRRGQEICRARSLVYHLARSLTDASLPTIGSMMRKDHTSVLKGAQVVEARMAQDDEYRRYVTGLETLLLMEPRQL